MTVDRQKIGTFFDEGLCQRLLSQEDIAGGHLAFSPQTFQQTSERENPELDIVLPNYFLQGKMVNMTQHSVLIREPVKKFLLKCSEEERRLYCKRLQDLADGHWSGRLRVKPVRGIRNEELRVFEGRLHKGGRMIFTLERDQSDGRLYVRVWGIYPKHPKNIGTEVNHLKPSFLIKAINNKVGRSKWNPIQVLESLPILDETYYFDEDRWYEECRPERWYELDDKNWQRLLDASANRELELRLDNEQKAVLNQPPPVLLTGIAGSGKTTLAIYYLCKYPDRRRLYITYSDSLCKHAKELYERLILPSDGYEAKLSPPDFRTFREFCKEIIGKDSFPTKSEVSYPLFHKWVKMHPQARKWDPALLWEEIRGVLKGSTKSAETPEGLLEFAQYMDLGRKRSLLNNQEPEEIYGLARWYQEKLKERRCWDELDLTREAWQAVQTLDPAWRYDLVVCDEVQDLTELQIALLFKLVRSREGVFLTGDVHQVITPTAFRWQEITTAFYKDENYNKPTPSVTSLEYNYRCTGKIIALGNALIDLKQKLNVSERYGTKQQARWGGESPRLIKDVNEHDLIEILRREGADRVIVVRTEQECERLKNKLGHDRVLTLFQAKGLEWDSVLLWKFLATSSETIEKWQAMLCGNTGNFHFRVIGHEIGLAYVGVTRARNRLFLYESDEAAPIWTKIADIIETAGLEDLGHAWSKASTPEEWLEEATRLMSHGKFELAAGAYRRADRHDLAAEAMARHHETLQEWDQAADYWEQAGHIQDAARCWEQAEEYDEAARCWRELGEDIRARRCDAMALEKSENWAKAAEIWEELEDWVLAAQARGLAKEWPLAAKGWERVGEWLKAGEAWRSAGLYKIAAKRFERAEAWLQAAEAWQRTGAWSEAARCWDKAGRRRDALRCRARHAIQTDDWESAARFYEEAHAWIEAEDCWIKAGNSKNTSKVRAMRYEDEQKYAQAAIEWARAEEEDRAGEAWERANDWVAAARWWEFRGKWEKAAECWERTKQQDGEERAIRCRARYYMTLRKWAVAARQWEQIRDWQEAARCWRYARNDREAIRCIAQAFEAEGALAQAAIMWEKVGMQETEASTAWKKAGQKAHPKERSFFEALALNMDRDQERIAKILEEQGCKFAPAYLLRTGKMAEAMNKDILLMELRSYQEEGIWGKAGEFAEELENWEQAARCWQNAEKWERAAANWRRLERQEEEEECLRKAALAAADAYADAVEGSSHL